MGFVFSGTRVHGFIAAAVVALAACGGSGRATAARSSITVVDDVGDTVRLSAPAKRVISLIPSATETIIALGATDRIVGRTRYDVAHEVDSVPSVGGGLDPSVEAIVALHPDVVIGWTDDKRRVIRTRLAALHVPVFSLRTQDTSDVFRGIRNLGALLGRDSAATVLAASIRATLDDVRRAVADRPQRNVMFVIYPDPPMTAGPGTFIDQLISVAGGRSVFSDLREPWPTLSMEEVVRRQPDLLIIPQGEFKANAIEQFRSRHGWRDLIAVRAGAIATVSANLTQRPGANIGEAARALQAAIHPETVGAAK
jgi:iron complex transport system substrate-binding protein